jgi:ankyrin repeat protein
MNDVAPRRAFLESALWSGGIEKSEAILAAHPELRSNDIHVAAVLGDDATVRGFIAADPALVRSISEPLGGDVLISLCFSNYLRVDRSRSASFVGAAAALLDAGTDPNTAFFTKGDHAERECALYGAAGVAHHEGLTRLLLERGADPNDGEVCYHCPESSDLGAMKAIVETGKVTPENLSMMLLRKHDWHDFDGAKWLLERGADPNIERSPGWLPLHHGIVRDNGCEMIELELDHGADPHRRRHGRTAPELAARRGRADVLEAMEKRGVDLRFDRVHELIAACARDDGETVRRISRGAPAASGELLNDGATLLAEFAGTWNAKGVGHLLDLGVPIESRYAGDAYFDIPKDSTALHVAVWKSTPPAVELLIARGADVNARDGRGDTPIRRAVKACVDSHWTERRSPRAVAALLAAGARAADVECPCGYDDVDALLSRR